MTHQPFSGVITAIVTPFTKQNTVDVDAFKQIVRMQKKSGISGIVVSGTTGESPTLSADEREELVKTALDEQSADFHIYVGTGSNDTRASVELSNYYAKFVHSGKKVDGVMAVVPYYNKPSPTGLKAHFTAIAKSIFATPLCVYNVPGRTVTSLDVKTFIALAVDCKNIVAIKEAAGSVQVITELRRAIDANLSLKSRDIQILSGDDATYAPALLCGADGVISVTSHIIPEALIEVLKAAREGRFADVRRWHLATYPLNTQIFSAPNPVLLKYALAKLGYCENILRLPLVCANETEINSIEAALAECNAAGVKIVGR